MKKISYKLIVLFVSLSLFLSHETHSQKGVVQIHKNSQIDTLLELKKEVNLSKLNYKIQIFSGARSGAEKAQKEFNQFFSEWNSEKQFETPNYKIWIGNFKTRLEADRALVKIKRKFSNAFYFKPKIDNVNLKQ
jgi:hypothetical protein